MARLEGQLTNYEVGRSVPLSQRYFTGNGSVIVLIDGNSFELVLRGSLLCKKRKTPRPFNQGVFLVAVGVVSIPEGISGLERLFKMHFTVHKRLN